MCIGYGRCRVFVSSRSRDTMCALVTGVQTYALTISGRTGGPLSLFGVSRGIVAPATEGFALARQPCYRLRTMASTTDDLRAEERRVGEGSVSCCRSRWSQYQYTQ